MKIEERKTIVRFGENHILDIKRGLATQVLPPEAINEFEATNKTGEKDVYGICVALDEKHVAYFIYVHNMYEFVHVETIYQYHPDHGSRPLSPGHAKFREWWLDDEDDQ